MANKLQEWALPAIALAFAGLCINFSWVQSLHDGDSILLALISTLRWTPFYWGDNRYGMPLPVLASWIHDPVWNLFFQTGLFCLAVVLLVTVTNLFFFHSRRTPISIRLATACVALALAFIVFRPTQRTVRALFLADPYVISLAPLLTAVALIFRVRSGIVGWIGAALLVFVSVWVNFSHAFLAVLLALSLPYDGKNWRASVPVRGVFIALVVACLVAVRAWAGRYSNWGEPGFAFQSTLVTASRMVSNAATTMVQPPALIAVMLFALLTGFWFWSSGQLRRRDFAIFVGLSLVFGLAVSTSDWPIHNAYEPRYWTTPILLLVLATTAWCARGVMALIERVAGSAAPAVAALALIGASLGVFGVPNPANGRGYVMAATGRIGVDTLKLGCTHMIGEYNAAWMGVFYARANGRDVYAAVPRAEVTRDLWDRMPPNERKFCATVNQGPILQSLTMFKLGLPAWSGYSGSLVRYELK